ncbi:hypothetical protein SpCBS45565_g06089 [Spizellomyces sp. 'palustris']|nr:hypothetical protein SpCBS45565_g06089 [Spizellomyces sp. 'palustris']
MSVTSLSIVSLTDFHLLTVEAGSRLKGYVNIHLSKPQKDINITLTLAGAYTATWPSSPSHPSGSEQGHVVKYTVVAYDSKQKGTGGVLPGGFHRIPIDINTTDLNGLDLRDLPPSFRYDAKWGKDMQDNVDDKIRVGSFQCMYTLKCNISWASGSKLVRRKTKICQVEVLVITPTRYRAKLLAFPYPSLIGNTLAPGSPRPDLWATPHRIVDKGLVRWSLTVPRRSCMAGDVLDCIVGLGPAPPNMEMDCVKLELSERATFTSPKGGTLVALSGAGEGLLPSASPTRVIAAVRESSWGRQNGCAETDTAAIRTLPIKIPWDASATMDTLFFKSVVVLRLTIRLVHPDGSTETSTIVELPIHIVAPDIRMGRPFPPILPHRKETTTETGISDLTDSAIDMGKEDDDDDMSCTDEQGVRFGAIPGVAPDTVVGTFKVVYPYFARGPEELGVRVGDVVHVSKSFADGWSYCSTTTTSTHPSGLIPTHHLVHFSLDPIPPLLGFTPPRSLPFLDARFLCRCEDRYLLWMEAVKEGVGFVVRPEMARIPEPLRPSNDWKVGGRAPVRACSRCRYLWMQERIESA